MNSFFLNHNNFLSSYVLKTTIFNFSQQDSLQLIVLPTFSAMVSSRVNYETATVFYIFSAWNLAPNVKYNFRICKQPSTQEQGDV